MELSKDSIRYHREIEDAKRDTASHHEIDYRDDRLTPAEVTDRQRYLDIADSMECDICGTYIPTNAASDPTYWIDCEQIPAGLQITIRCPYCW